MSVKLHKIEMVVVPDESPDPSYLYQEGLGFEDRRAAYERGEFGFVGVKAVAEINISGIIETIESPGLWGIEDDSGDEHLKDVYRDELSTLYEMLKELKVEFNIKDASTA